MKLADQFRAVKALPKKIEETSNLIAGLLILSILAFVMSGCALMIGARRAH